MGGRGGVFHIQDRIRRTRDGNQAGDGAQRIQLKVAPYNKWRDEPIAREKSVPHLI